MRHSDVLIVGAGPTGLALALWLVKQGVTPRIIDKLDGPLVTSRALAVQARTLELYRQLDLADEVVEKGHKVPGLNLWVRGERQARVPFDAIGAGVTPYGPLIFPQDQHERLLIARLEQRGVSVERSTELVGFVDRGDTVVATLRGPGDREEECDTRYLAGCDGARSIVRRTIGADFPGGTYQHVFHVADVEAAGPAIDGELHIDLDDADFLAVFPLKGEGRARLVGTIRDDRAEAPESLRFEDVSQRAIQRMKVDVRKVNWFSTYRVHHRVTDRFRAGRAFLLGDAAHIHSPAGGQGMNTGIGDAINLAWKLKAVLAGQASDALLDTYQVERRAFARRLVATTDKGFTLATAEGRVANFLRTRVVPLVVPTLFSFEAARDYLFGAVSQVLISYHESAISEGRAGDVRGGDRLPWVAAPGADNFDALRAIGWQAHVYGEATSALRGWCAARELPLHMFDWTDAHGTAGLARDGLYLLRPDTYVAFAAATQDTEELARYFERHGLSPSRKAAVNQSAHPAFSALSSAQSNSSSSA